MNVILKLTCLVALAAHATALITSPPRIVKQPVVEELPFVVASDGEEEKPFTLDCEAEGEPKPYYFWSKNGQPFEYTRYESRISQQPGRGSLVFRLPRAEDAGQYQCFARNQYGTATSNSVFVRRIGLQPFGDEFMEIRKAVEGEPLKLYCNPPNGWPKPKVIWMQLTYDSQNNITDPRITCDPEGNLWFSNVHDVDGSPQFVCMAYLPAFINSYKPVIRVYLHVTPRLSATDKEPVRLYTTRSNEDALRGEKVEIYCIYGGRPRPDVVWKKDGVLISSTHRYKLSNFGKTLVIRRADNEDQGSYTCEVSNGIGTNQTHTVNLSIKAAPIFTEEPQSLTLREGETAVFRCRAAGTPDPQIQWIHNGQPLDVAWLGSNLTRTTVSDHSVTIVDLRRSDTGNYGCNASNSYGYVYKDVYINVPSLCQLPPHPSVTYYCKLNDPRAIDGRRLCDELEPSGTEVVPACNRPNYYERGILTNMHCIDGNWNYIAVCHPECGTTTPNGTELVVGGARAERGELPWHAGVYDATTTPYMQICGGSLVSTAIVISAAHCFYRRDALRRPAEFAVALGKIYRPWANPQDQGAQDQGAHTSNVSDIRIPSYYTGAASNHQADIALVFLATPAQLAVYIRPVCVEFDDIFDARQLQRGRSGKVAGWGLTGADATPSRVLLTINMPFVDVDTCIADIPYLALDKFCAGDKNGTSLCQGDSGGGLAFPADERGARRYYLRGVVSTAPSDAHACNLHTYTTFTRIHTHEAFIKQNLNH